MKNCLEPSRKRIKNFHWVQGSVSTCHVRILHWKSLVVFMDFYRVGSGFRRLSFAPGRHSCVVSCLSVCWISFQWCELPVSCFDSFSFWPTQSAIFFSCGQSSSSEGFCLFVCFACLFLYSCKRMLKILYSFHCGNLADRSGWHFPLALVPHVIFVTWST